jgi:hypothetical protein
MQYGLLSLLPVQVARMFGLVRNVTPAKLPKGRRQWALLIEGRGFSRLLMKEPSAIGLCDSAARWLPAPKCFPTEASALAYAQSVGLLPAKRRWKVSADRSTS